MKTPEFRVREDTRKNYELSYSNGAVIYWMSRDHRINDNWALYYAYEKSIVNNVPLICVYVVREDLISPKLSTHRNFIFMALGLNEVSQKLKSLNIPFYIISTPITEAFSELDDLISISELVTDFNPMHFKNDWEQELLSNTNIPLTIIDSHNLVPPWKASNKEEYSARTFRKKLWESVDRCHMVIPKIESFDKALNSSVFNLNFDSKFKIKSTTNKVEFVPGPKAAQQQLHHFVNKKLLNYTEDRNNPNAKVQSDLSPYLHYGSISTMEVYELIRNLNNSESFLEEFVVRRELAENFCYYNSNYDDIKGFPAWSQKTLNLHRKDERQYIYSLDEFEEAKTHDNLWNAAQTELVKTGKIHGYIRMYWGKKFLEWTDSPETAISYAITLNDKHSIDGRDPNGYTGIAWSIGGVHDRPFKERPIFGKIRWMSYNGMKGKFDVDEYISTWIAE